MRKAVENRNEEIARKALKEVIPTFYNPKEINENAVRADEMQMVAS